MPVFFWASLVDGGNFRQQPRSETPVRYDLGLERPVLRYFPMRCDSDVLLIVGRRSSVGGFSVVRRNLSIVRGPSSVVRLSSIARRRALVVGRRSLVAGHRRRRRRPLSVVGLLAGRPVARSVGRVISAVIIMTAVSVLRRRPPDPCCTHEAALFNFGLDSTKSGLYSTKSALTSIEFGLASISVGLNLGNLGLTLATVGLDSAGSGLHSTVQQKHKIRPKSTRHRPTSRCHGPSLDLMWRTWPDFDNDGLTSATRRLDSTAFP